MVCFAFATTIAALFAVASAQQLSITAPNRNVWWVAKSENVMTWTCQTSPYTNFTVLIANADPKILTAPLAFIGIQENGDCSKEVTQDQANQAPGQGYTILFADPFNETNIYATSDVFEIKALGSAYPTQVSAAPSASGAPGSSGSSSTNDSPSLKMSAGLGLVALGAVLGLMA